MKGMGMTKGRARALFAMMLAIVLGACSLIGLSGCGSASSPTGSDTLRVGVRADIVNFGYLNEQTGKYYGMEIDLANEMANRLGYSNVELVTVLPDNRKEMLLNGEVDCLVACYSKTDTRLENFDFSPIYYTDATPVMVENSSRITDINQLMALLASCLVQMLAHC